MNGQSAGLEAKSGTMTHAIDTITLPHGRPGTSRTVRIHRFGQPGARPKAYIQAGLHAGELPGMLVAQLLVQQLAELDAVGAVTGEIVLVPMANPIGLDQMLLGTHLGRFDLAAGVNFNRSFADLWEPVAQALRDGRIGPLGPDAESNRRLIQQALADAAQALTPRTEADALRRLLLLNAVDADLMLDLHCDSEAAMHLYTTPACWPDFADLAARLGCLAALLAESSGGEPFDEACSTPWDRLRALFDTPETPIPVGCHATTVELRGESDVDDGLAAHDSVAIMGHLAWRGVLNLPASAMEPDLALATPLAAVDRVRAPVGGVALYHVALGDQVTAGQHVATVMDPATGERHLCHADTDGPVWSRRQCRYVGPGDILLSIAGREVLVTEGNLLTA